MKHLCLIPAALLLVFGCGLHAQAVDTTVCAVIKDPVSFDGKMVRIKGTVSIDFDQFVVSDGDCRSQVNGIWLAYPQGSKAKSGPMAVVEVEPAHNFSGKVPNVTRAAVTLDKSKDFKQFDSLLSQPHKRDFGMCMGCSKNKVSATLVGRLDAVADAEMKRDATGKIVSFGGFGNMNLYPARLVIQSVSDVAAKEIDYSKADEASKNDMQAATPGAQQGAVGGGLGDPGDPMAEMRKIVAGMPAGQVTTLTQQAIDVYPKPKESNGVLVSYGVENEARDLAIGSQDSPDGVVFEVKFNKDRLEGSQLTFAMLQKGLQIAAVRHPEHLDEIQTAFTLEYNAWVVMTNAAITAGRKTMTLPNGALLWNGAWPMADRLQNVNNALKDLMRNEMQLIQ